MNIENYLDDLGEQKLQEEKKIVVVENPILEVLCRKYEEWLKKITDYANYWTNYGTGFELIKKAKYTAKDVKDFSFLLKRYERNRFFESTGGLFLSAVINNSQESNLEVITGHFNQIDCVGYCNKKNLIIFGNAGYGVGHGCQEGLLRVVGNAGRWTGSSMDGGTLIVEGNTGDDTGWCMSGGKLIVKGNAGDHTGWHMSGGEIHVEGKIVSIGPDCLGKVYREGKLVWPV